MRAAPPGPETADTLVYSGMSTYNCALFSVAAAAAAAASSWKCGGDGGVVGEVASEHAIPVAHRMAEAASAVGDPRHGASVSSAMVSAVAEPRGEYATLP